MTQPIPPDWAKDELPPAEQKALADALAELIAKHRIEVPQ